MFTEQGLLSLSISLDAISERVVYCKGAHLKSLAGQEHVSLVLEGQSPLWELNHQGATASLEQVYRDPETILGPQVAGAGVKWTENYKLSKKFSA